MDLFRNQTVQEAEKSRKRGLKRKWISTTFHFLILQFHVINAGIKK
jgi:hypothetical protein